MRLEGVSIWYDFPLGILDMLLFSANLPSAAVFFAACCPSTYQSTLLYHITLHQSLFTVQDFVATLLSVLWVKAQPVQYILKLTTQHEPDHPHRFAARSLYSSLYVQ